MNLLIRAFYVFISSFFKPKITDVLAPSFLKLRVLPNDLDFNMHMNNGRYLTLMDLGRLDLILRTGLFKIMVREASVPILAAATIRYRLSLDPFQKYTIQTQIAGWDEKWFFIEQKFLMGSGPKQGEVAAIGLVKGCFLNSRTKSTVRTQDVLTSINYTGLKPTLPQHFIDWQLSEQSLKEVTRHA